MHPFLFVSSAEEKCRFLFRYCIWERMTLWNSHFYISMKIKGILQDHSSLLPSEQAVEVLGFMEGVLPFKCHHPETAISG